VQCLITIIFIAPAEPAGCRLSIYSTLDIRAPADRYPRSRRSISAFPPIDIRASTGGTTYHVQHGNIIYSTCFSTCFRCRSAPATHGPQISPGKGRVGATRREGEGEGEGRGGGKGEGEKEGEGKGQRDTRISALPRCPSASCFLSRSGQKISLPLSGLSRAPALFHGL
jgi:hypothetical protein